MVTFKLAIKDRMNLLEKSKNISFSKIISLDLVIKYIILVINSFGKKGSYDLIYVNEINNKNMRDNLYETRKNVKIRSQLMCFSNFNNFSECLKIGRLKSIFMLLIFIIEVIIITCFFWMFILFSRKIYSKIVLLCIYINFKMFIKLIDFSKHSVIVLMSDHHFFGAIIANIKSLNYKSVVIQHGAICDISYYAPVYADKFLAWGEASSKKINNKKVCVSGTYKFKNINLCKNESNDSIKILWPLRPLDDDILEKMYKLILDSLNNVHLLKKELIIKKHPSIFSDFNFSKSIFSEFNVKYIDSDLEKIEFDLAIIDNSTIGYDLIMLNKPFIVFENLINNELDIGYGKYGISSVSNYNDLSNEINRFIINREDYFKDFHNITNVFIKKELNDNKCYISKIINELQEA